MEEVVRGKEKVFGLLQYDEFNVNTMDRDTNVLLQLLLPIASHAEAKAEEDRLIGVVLYFEVAGFVSSPTKNIEWTIDRGFLGRTSELLRLLFEVMSTNHQKKIGEMAEHCHKFLQNATAPIVVKMEE